MSKLPLFQEFNPKHIPWQWDATKCIRNFDYSTGALELFFSGGVGSAKSIEHIHELVKNCLEQPNSKWLMVRRTLKDLKRTSWGLLLRHMADISPLVVKSYNKTEMKIEFWNGSTILGDSYDDGDETKFQSLELSSVDIEEGNEMSEEIYTAIKLRVGRAGVPINRIQIRCNPDSPMHWLYKYFNLSDLRANPPTRKVFYSLTEQNPFLPKWYIENLRRDLDPKMVRRKIYGEWIEINDEMIYYNYSSEVNFKRDEIYKINPKYPVAIMHDFNIGNGKPMSAAVGQFVEGIFHVKKTYIVEGFRTKNILDEMANDGVFEYNARYIAYGDASGKSRDTRNNKSDWDIIEDYLSNYKQKSGKMLDFDIDVPESNPAIRTRHNKVNAYFKNDLGEVRFYVYQEAADADEGFRLTKLKKGSVFQEDDSFAKQHVTTAIGYWIVYVDEYGTQQTIVRI